MLSRVAILGLASIAASAVSSGGAQAAVQAEDRAGEALVLNSKPKRVLIRADLDSTPDVGEGVAPADGRRLVAVVISVENVAARTVRVSPASSLAVIDSTGQEATRRPDRCGRTLERARLGPGHRRSGCVLFETASDTTVAQIRYTLTGARRQVAGLWSVDEQSGRGEETPSVARRYPRRVRNTFVAECKRTSGGLTGVCRCSLRGIERQYSYRSFLRLDRAQRRGSRLPKKVRRIVGRCVRSNA
ncbi:MAG TPA: hypothetical protein VF529_18460 [Solirubrobacteraceae bacterium]